MIEDEASRIPTPDEFSLNDDLSRREMSSQGSDQSAQAESAAGQPDAHRLREEAATAEGSFTKRVKEARADELESAGAIGEVAARRYDEEHADDATAEDAAEEVQFERIKQDVLNDAKEYALHGIEENFFHGFYDHDKPRRPYARVIKGDFSKGFDQRTIEYDENLTAEETDDIRRAIYEQFGATPPPDEEFDRQKKPREGYPQLGDKLAIVDTPTNMPGVKIQEIRRWRVNVEEVAAEHGVDVLEFTQWFIRVITDEYVAQPEQPLTPATVESAGTSETETDQNLKEQAEDALKELDKIMDENRQNPNRLVQKSLDQARKYLESLSDLDV